MVLASISEVWSGGNVVDLGRIGEVTLLRLCKSGNSRKLGPDTAIGAVNFISTEVLTTSNLHT